MNITYQQRGSVKEIKIKITDRYRIHKRQMILWGHIIWKDGLEKLPHTEMKARQTKKIIVNS